MEVVADVCLSSPPPLLPSRPTTYLQAGADLGLGPPGPWPGAQRKSHLVYRFFSQKIYPKNMAQKDLLLAAI
jgi:hypothetical protein